jgi:hypothetical protein
MQSSSAISTKCGLWAGHQEVPAFTFASVVDEEVLLYIVAHFKATA